MKFHRLDVFGTTDVGRVREENEDQFFIASIDKSVSVRQTSIETADLIDCRAEPCAWLLAVADGCGGMAHGRRASQMAVRIVMECVGNAIDCYYETDSEGEGEFLERLRDAVESAHESVHREVSERAGQAGTTLTLVALVWPRAYVAHVGDSRAYLLRGERLRQITRDQTMAESMLDQGLMTEEAVSNLGLDHILTSAVGGTIVPTFTVLDLQPGDNLLLCTDGLTKHVNDVEITDALLRSNGSAALVVESLQSLALERGGTDNVTVVAACSAAAAE